MKCVQISILARISGNVNADENVGNRITIKKMYDSEGNTYPFVSARAIKYAIRMKLKEMGFSIDPFYLSDSQLIDSGKPWEFVDNDLFGYLVPSEDGSKRRTAPVSISYFKALRNTNISTDFAGRFPREDTGTNKSSNKDSKNVNPNIFEIEVADIIGKFNIIMYDYIGKPSKFDKEEWEIQITEEERRKRISSLLRILLIERFVLPRRTNSLNIPEYYYALVSLSKSPLPVYDYLNYQVLNNGMPELDYERIKDLVDFLSLFDKNEKPKIYLIDYTGKLDITQLSNIIKGNIEVIEINRIGKLIDDATNWLL